MRIAILTGTALAAILMTGCGGGNTEKPAAKSETPAAPPKILHFYSTENPVPAGSEATLCYGTEDADEVSLSPYDDTLRPALNRCIAVKPTKPTTYTLRVKGKGGEATAEVALAIGGAKPAAPPAAGAPAKQLIQTFQSIGGGSVAPGTPVQFCYTTVEATRSVSVQPAGPAALKPGTNQCFTMKIDKTTNVILSARDAAGALDRMQVTVRVP